MTVEFLSMREAREYLGCSKTKMWRLVKGRIIPVYSDPLDKRKQLVRKDDIEKLRQPQPRSRD